MDRLRSLQTFVRAADLGSFHRAAAAEGVSSQAVSKAIRRLEDELGVRLFHRSTRRSQLTDEGERLLARVRSGLDQIDRAWDDVREATLDAGGQIRIASAQGFARRVLVPFLLEFRRQHPRIDFELVVEDRYTDLVASGIDLGFRCGYPPEGQVVVRELFRMQLVTCAAPAYLRARGVPARRADLAAHVCTGSRQPNTGRIDAWEFRNGDEVEFEEIASPFLCNDGDTELEAVLGGLGIGMIDSVIAGHHLRAGRLVPVLCDTISERYGAFLYYPQRATLTRRVRLFVDAAVDWIRTRPDWRLAPGEAEALLAAFLASGD